MRQRLRHMPAVLLKWAIGLLIPVLMFVLLASVPDDDVAARSADRDGRPSVETPSGGHPEHATPRSYPKSPID